MIFKGIDIDDPLQYIPAFFRILSKADAMGQSQLLPMKLWPSQEFYIRNRTHRDIVLKSRQHGASTGIMASDGHALFTVPYQRLALITNDQETSEFLFQTIQRFYRNLPDEIRPKTDWKSGSRMRFPDLDSYIYIDSAKSDTIGIGHTLNRAHLSEVAKYPPARAESLFADISQTVPGGGYITLESTPKGRVGLFYRLYDAAKRGEINYKPFFFPWWWDITCVRETKELEYTAEEKDLIDLVARIEKLDLKPEQIAFRREKLAELGELFYQEYPENDIDCWLSSDINVFDGLAVRRYLQQIQKGREEGNWTIWKDCLGGERYVIGVDVAAGIAKGDYSVASVLRVKTNEYVARARARIPPDFFAEDVLRLASRYNNAMIAVERIGHGHSVIRTLLEKHYPNLYFYQEYDDRIGGLSSIPGWNTSRKSKPIMVNLMRAALRSGDLISWSENLMLEASSYVYEGQDNTRSSGGHDDELMAVMIALAVRDTLPIMNVPRHQPVSYIRVGI